MPKKSKSKPKLNQEQKSQLGLLQRLGLYSPTRPHAAPTRYGASLLGKFSDVLSGIAKAITTNLPFARTFRDKSAKPGEIRSKGKKVIVPVMQGERARFNKSSGEIEVIRKLGTGERYIRKPFKKKIRDFDDIIDQIGEDDRIAVPYWRGPKRGYEWHYFDEEEFYNEFIGGYGDDGKSRAKAIKWALAHAQISQYVEDDADLQREHKNARRRELRAQKRAGVLKAEQRRERKRERDRAYRARKRQK